MSDNNPVSIHLPDDLMISFREAAVASNRPVEELVIETLRLHPPLTGEDIEGQLEALSGYTDEQLWAVTGWHLSPVQESRRLQLVRKSKITGLIDSEKHELETLLDLMRQYVALHAEALALLKSRGHEISHLINPSGL